MKLQEFIHSLEQGNLSRWIFLLVVIFLMVLGWVWFVLVEWPWQSHFRALTDAKGIDQAQVAREIARGNGFTTNYIRPIAYAQFRNHGSFPLDKTPDTYHAPLGPYVNAVALSTVKAFRGVDWDMTKKDHVFWADRAIASVAVILMALSIGVNYLTARRVFDENIAGLSMGLMLICNQYWVFAVTGLPQMLMFFLFSCGTFILFRAIENHRAEKPTWRWLIGLGVVFGLLALTHPITIWIFVGLLIFSIFYFVPRGLGVGIMVAVFLVLYTPWLVRNYKVCGNPFGLGYLTLIGTMDGSEQERMREQDPSMGGLSLGALRNQMRTEAVSQMGQIYNLLGGNPLAPVFFVTLLYVFKRREASDLMWATFLMLLFAFMGMTISGLDNANNLYLLFTPIMTLYGFAYIMMLWSRLEINITILRIIFIIVLYCISGFPLVSNILTDRPWYPWPPYCPPGISILKEWTHDDEVIASDMPWAVGWYADRKSLEIPLSMSEFLNFYDWTEFNGHLVGLYLTPVTGNKRLVSEILKGDDKDWAPLILRGVRLKDFPFHAAVPLPLDNECIFYCESDRWSQKTD